MAEILFDISLRSKIEAGEYKVVVRYDNRTFNARIICWDFNSTDLLVCVNYGDKEDVLEYDWNGKHVGKSIRRPDLLIVTPESEPEFTEFEKRLWEIMKSEGSPIGPLEKFTDDDKRVFHAYSGQLLALARKQLQPEIDAEIAKAYKNADKIVYENGVLYGKTEALNGLPRWKKCAFQMGAENPFPRYLVRTGGAHYSLTSTILKCDEYIPLSELAKLPKEDDHE